MNTGEPMLQPPDPEDLRRYPPADESCLRVRGLLRDYADGELEPALRAAVDLHVHSCRACALALSRAEHEVWRLRRALAGGTVAEPAGVPRGFSGRTVERLVRELSRATPSPVAAVFSGAPGQPSVGGSNPGSGNAVSGALRMRRLLGYCAVVAAAVAAMSLLLWRGYADVDRTARAMVVAAEYARFGNGAQSMPAAPGEVLTEGATLTVGAGGHAELEWNDTEPRRQPAATLLLQGGSQVQVAAARPLLLDGAVEIDSQRRMVVTTPDGAVVELGRGVYHFDVVDYREFDAALREERSDLRVRLEVQAGEAARVVRAGGETRPAAGQVAQWHGWSATSLDGLPSPSALANGIGAVRDPDPLAAHPPALIGSVYVQPVGAPAVGASLLLWFLERGQQGLCATQTDSTGTFRVPSDRQVEGDFVIAQLFPPGDRSDLGLRAPEAYPLLRTNQVRLQAPLVFEPTTDMNGRVMDREQRPVANVRVLPCVVDELFGLLLPWVEGRVMTDTQGNFTLRGLPTTLPPHQHLELLLLHSDYGPRFEPVPLPNSWAFRAMRLAFTLPPLVTCNVIFADHRNQQLELFEELADLPPGAAARHYAVTTDGLGRPSQPLRVGNGRLWLRTGSPTRPSLRPITVDTSGPQAIWTVGDVARPQAGVLRSLDQVSGTDYLLAHEYRYQRFRAPVGDHWLLSAVEDVTGRAAPQAQLFTVGTGPLPTPRFLGLYDGHLGVAANLGDDGSVVAVDGMGQVGTGQIERASTGRSTVHLVSTGRLVLDERLRPSPTEPQQVVTLRLLPREGLLAGSQASFVRFATAAEEWTVAGIVPGTYQVQGVGSGPLRVTVAPGEVATIR